MTPTAATGRSMKSVLKDAAIAETLKRLSKRHGIDEADVARLWSRCDDGRPRETVSRVEDRLRIVKSLEDALRAACRASNVRVSSATSAHVRALAVMAANRLVSATPEEIRRFVKEALPESIG